MTSSKDDAQHLIAKTDAVTSNSPPMSTIAYRHDMPGPEALSSTNYFPNIIDTSTYLFLIALRV